MQRARLDKSIRVIWMVCISAAVIAQALHTKWWYASIDLQTYIDFLMVQAARIQPRQEQV